MKNGWTRVLYGPALAPERGVAVLVGADQVAVFRTYAGDLRAIDHLDPCSGAHVLARGIVGTRGGADVVSSPMHKQAFDLRTGECLDVPGVRVRVWPVRERDGFVEVGPALVAAGP